MKELWNEIVFAISNSKEIKNAIIRPVKPMDFSVELIKSFNILYLVGDYYYIYEISLDNILSIDKAVEKNGEIVYVIVDNKYNIYELKYKKKLYLKVKIIHGNPLSI